MPDWMFQLVGYLVTGGMAYGAIRSDLKHLNEKAHEAQQLAARSHRRIDDHIERHHVRKSD